MHAVADLARRATAAGARLHAARDRARTTGVAVVRSLEAGVVRALAGDVLRGLSNINRRGGVLHAARVGGSPHHGIDTYLPDDGRMVLVVHKDGRLLRAAALPDGEVRAWAAEDGDLLAQDVEPVVRAYQAALERHLARAARTEASYARVEDLARRVAGAIGFVL